MPKLVSFSDGNMESWEISPWMARLLACEDADELRALLKAASKDESDGMDARLAALEAEIKIKLK